MIKGQLKRAIFNKKFLFIIFIGLLIHFLSVYNEIYKYLFFDFKASDIQTPKLQANARGMVNDALNMYSVWFDSLILYTPLMPILSALPFSSSYLQDTKNGMIKYFDLRTSHKKYLITKFFTNGLSGGLAISLPTIILTIVVKIFFSGNINNFFGKGAYGGPFASLLLHNFYLYVLVHVFIEFIFGFTYANIALATSAFIKNTIAVMMSPFLFWVGGSLVLELFNINSYLPTEINQFYLSPNITFTEIIIELSIITLFSFVLFIFRAGKRNIYE